MARTTVVTGASGFAGRIIAAAMLAAEDDHLILPIRARHDPQDVLRLILDEVRSYDATARIEGLEERVRFTGVPASGDEARDDWSGATEIVHAAGCVDYFDEQRLLEGNQHLTTTMLAAGKALNVERFTFISTAFSSGHPGDAIIPEALHADDFGEDLTRYMASKRACEWLVARSGLPHLILRPCVLIGHSEHGGYTGQPYGVAQIWEGISRLMLSRYRPDMHFVSPWEERLPVLHQDTFQDIVLWSRRHLDDGDIVNMALPIEDTVRTRRYYSVVTEFAHPERVYYYDRFEDLPIDTLYTGARAFLSFCAVNIDISERPWYYERTSLERLMAKGLRIAPVTEESVGRCFAAFAAKSKRARRFIDKFSGEFADETLVFESCGTDLPAAGVARV